MRSVIFVTGAFMCTLPLCATPHTKEPASAHTIQPAMPYTAKNPAHAIQPAMPYTAENLLGVDKDPKNLLSVHKDPKTGKHTVKSDHLEEVVRLTAPPGNHGNKRRK